MKNKRIFGLSFAILLVASVLLFSFGVLPLNQNVNSIESNENTFWNAYDCVYITRVDGSIEDLGCKHNLVTTVGLNHIRNELFNSMNSSDVTYIGLCNATAGCTGADAGDTTLDNEFASAGLERGAGTVGIGGTGNASVWYTFTASETVSTNQTGLFNASSSGTLIAENTFTLANLESGDQLTINKTVSFA